MTVKTPGKSSKAKASIFPVDNGDSPLIVPRVLPRGLNSLPRDIVLVSQRSRLIEATAHCVCLKGYAATSVADIIARAGVSRTTFYQQFKDKEDCYLDCYNRLARSHIEHMVEALTTCSDPKEQLIASIEAYLSHLADDGEYAIAFFAEAENAGGKVQELVAELKAVHKGHLLQWHKLLCEEQPDLVAPPYAAVDMILDGAHAFLIRWVREGFPQSISEARRNVCYVIFASLGLHDWAKEQLTAE